MTDKFDPHVMACQLLSARKARRDFFDAGLFGEPAWDMLLELYCRAPHARRDSVSGLCQAAGVPQTTALRWQDIMLQSGLIRRIPDPADARRQWVELSEDGARRIEGYCRALASTVEV